MPLKAIVDEKTVTGPDCSEAVWADLALRHKKGLPVTMACCGAPGHLRKSRCGTQHFYHATGTSCPASGESWEHLEIKNLVYQACKAEGWETSVEYRSYGSAWIADVYAARGGRKVVFEIQVSPLTLADLGDRDMQYRSEGIESYWLVAQFMKKTGDAERIYQASLSKTIGHPLDQIPYLDLSLFKTGPENHLFIARGIRSIGLHTKGVSLFSTNNPEIPVPVWVREVLRGNYSRYLETVAAATGEKTRLVTHAAPVLFQFRELYERLVRNHTCRKGVQSFARLRHRDAGPEAILRNRNLDQILGEIDWLEREFRSCMAESTGIFLWKTLSGTRKPLPFFRPESEEKIQKLREYVFTFARWEASFHRAMQDLEQQASGGK